MRRSATIAVAVLAFSAIPGPAEAQSLRQTYQAAEAALAAQKWREAEHHLRQSLEMRPEPAKRLPMKRIFGPYLPHYYLGIARVQQGDCRQALDAWDRSKSAGVVQFTEAWPQLQQQERTCRAHLARLQALSERARRRVGEAQDLIRALEAPEHQAVLDLGFEGGQGSLRQRLETSRAELATADELLNRGEQTQSPDLAAEALALAETSAERLTGALDEAGRLGERQTALGEQQEEKLAAVRELANQVDRLLRSRSSLPPSVRGRRQQLESLLAGARSLPASATVPQMEGLERRLQSFRELLQTARASPPGTLRSGAIAYLRADYLEVLERLAEITSTDAKTRGHGYLLRSAAAYALHLASDSTDMALLDRALTDVLAAKASLPSLVPPATAFSPRFIRFFERIVPTDNGF